VVAAKPMHEFIPKTVSWLLLLALLLLCKCAGMPSVVKSARLC